MDITQLQTPYSRKRVIEYGTGARCNMPVRHWYDVQQITGPLYKDREEKNKYDELQCSLYLFYEGVQDGLRLQRCRPISEKATPEYLSGCLRQAGIDTLEGFLAAMEKKMAGSRWIGNAEIEFVRQIDTKKAVVYAQYRQKRIEADELERQRQSEEERAESLAADAEIQKAKAAQRAEYEGWAETMTSLQFGRVKKVLEKKVCWEGRIVPRREFIKDLLAKGYAPVARLECGKTVYLIMDREKDEGFTLTKTAFDFASFLAASKQDPRG